MFLLPSVSCHIAYLSSNKAEGYALHHQGSECDIGQQPPGAPRGSSGRIRCGAAHAGSLDIYGHLTNHYILLIFVGDSLKTRPEKQNFVLNHTGSTFQRTIHHPFASIATIREPKTRLVTYRSKQTRARYDDRNQGNKSLFCP